MLSLILLNGFAFGMKRQDYEFRISVNEPTKDDIDIYGKFTAEEGKFGGIEIAFYGSKYSYSLREIEDPREIDESAGSTNFTGYPENVRTVVKLFVKPTLGSSNKIVLSSKMITMKNKNKGGKPEFEISRLSFTREVSDHGETYFTVPTEPGKEAIMLKLETIIIKRLFKDISLDTLSFDARYCLYDRTNDRYDVKDEKCRLYYNDPASDAKPGCTHHKTYHLKNGDSLLYMVQYRIEDVEFDNGRPAGITLNVKRYYIMNPINYYSNLGDIDDTDTANVGPYRTIDIEKSINGKKREVHAIIDKGRIVEFRMDDIELLDKDIIANWDDVVTILRQIETTGKYKYLPPLIESPFVKYEDDANQSSLLNDPDNYTGDFVKMSAFSKKIAFDSSQEIKIEIQYGEDNYLPFSASESIIIDLP
jgi:hypothetical protein